MSEIVRQIKKLCNVPTAENEKAFIQNLNSYQIIHKSLRHQTYNSVGKLTSVYDNAQIEIQ